MKKTAILTALFLTAMGGAYAHEAEVRLVSKVLSGDTLRLDNGEVVRMIGVETPKLDDDKRNRKRAESIGVSFEKYSLYAVKSKEFLEKIILGRKVEIIYDEKVGGVEHRDDAEQLLVYVKMMDGRSDISYSIHLNEQLRKARKGWLKDVTKLDHKIHMLKGQLDTPPPAKGYLLNAIVLSEGFSPFARQASMAFEKELASSENTAKKYKKGFWGISDENFKLELLAVR